MYYSDNIDKWKMDENGQNILSVRNCVLLTKLIFVPTLYICTDMYSICTVVAILT